jgi:hypothetical protein
MCEYGDDQDLGTACKTEGQTCDYGACTVPGGVYEQCIDGSWAIPQVGCPG